MATYALGDIQGCYKPLRCLLEQIDFNSNRDTLWFAGDLVNRGPQNLETLRYIMSLGKSAKSVLGNHDLHLLAVAAGSAKIKKKDTIQDILDAPDRSEIIEWLKQQTLIISEPINQGKAAPVYTLVHAGIPPQWSIQDALKFAGEVSSTIRSEHSKDFFDVMYGNEPAQWSDSLTGHDRLRIITNYLTRMRFCQANGTLELKTKSAPHKAPKGYKPWFLIESRKTINDNILFGHWAALKGETGDQKVHAIDTGCVWGNKLSALRLEDETLFSCDCNDSSE